MGNTCSSVHVALKGSTADVIAGLVRAYGALGFEPAATGVEGARHVIVLRKDGDAFASVYDSDNAALDTGDLKQLALTASKLLKTAAVCTSLYDSDTFELVLFNAGKQVDLVMTNPEEYNGPLKVLTDKSRATQWSKVFGTPLSADRIRQARSSQSAFADDALAELSRLIGLNDGRSQLNYQDVREEDAFTHHLHFTRQASAAGTAAGGSIVLRDYFDPDNSRMLLVYPASWPVPLREEARVTWLMLSEGGGFRDGTLAIRIAGPDGLAITRGFMEGSKFHNGQIVGPLETAPREPAGATVEEILKPKYFEVTSDTPSTFTAGFPVIDIPAKAPDRPTQILIVLQLNFTASQVGEWEIDVTVKPGPGTDVVHALPRVRLAAVEQTWLPIVSGLNSKADYEASDLATAAPRGPLMLHELQYKQSGIRLDRTLNHFAIASNAGILRDAGQENLDACRGFLEAWLQPFAARSGEIRVRAEKRMTERAYVGKSRKALPAATFLRDKTWQKLFDAAGNYQTVLADIVPEGAAYPIAGVGIQVGLEQYREQWRAHYEQRVADTLRLMRGRRFDPAPIVNTAHVFMWVLNHPECYEYMGTTIADMKDRLDAFARGHHPLQAWHSQYTWRPLFDHADEYRRTVYEDHSVLNWFRGILQNDGGLDGPKMSLQWCANVLRMVTPHMWICGALLDQVDRSKLDTVADVSEAGDVFRIALKDGRALDDLELALLPVLPVESARIHPR